MHCKKYFRKSSGTNGKNTNSPKSIEKFKNPMSNFSPKRTPALYEWPEEDEINLLLAVRAIAQEPAADYNPRINLFDRIEIVLKKRFAYEVILSKVNELRQRFYETRGLIESNSEVQRNKIFLVSKDIWELKENNGELCENRSLENGNLEAEVEIKDAERNEMVETEVNEEGAQSGSGNEKVAMEDREEDAQSGYGNETMEVEEHANNSPRDFEKETVEANAKKNEIERGVGNEKIEMENKEQGKQRIRNRDDESKCMDSNKCGKRINVTNKRRLQTVLLEKRKQRHNFKSRPVIKKQTVLLEKKKQQQNLKSQSVSKKQTLLLEKKKQQQNLMSSPVSKKQKTGVKLYECGNLGDTASSCVQRKVVEYPTKKQETGDDTKVGQLEATTNKAVESSTTNKAVELSNESEPIRSEPIPKENTANQNIEEKTKISESVSYHHTSDNIITETSGKNNYEATNNKAVESSNTAKPIRSEPVIKEHRANKNFEEKATISESGSYHHPFDYTRAETSGKFKSENTHNKAVDLPNETKAMISEPVPTENKANKNIGDKTTISESCCYHHIPDNMKAESAGNFKSETINKKDVESSNETEPLRSEPGSKEHISNKNSEEKATISKSSSYHQTSEETSGKSKFDDHNRPTLEQTKPTNSSSKCKHDRNMSTDQPLQIDDDPEALLQISWGNRSIRWIKAKH